MGVKHLRELMKLHSRQYWFDILAKLGAAAPFSHLRCCVTQEKHGLKLRKPLSEVVNFESADAMLTCESWQRRAVLTIRFNTDCQMSSFLQCVAGKPEQVAHCMQATATCSLTPPSCARLHARRPCLLLSSVSHVQFKWPPHVGSSDTCAPLQAPGGV
jgi:hypothetical protein